MVILRTKFIGNNSAYKKKNALRYPFTMYEQKNVVYTKKNSHIYDNKNFNPDGIYGKRKEKRKPMIGIF